VIEKIRLELIRWNAAPLTVVGILCYFTNWLIDILGAMSCTNDDNACAASYAALTVLIAAMAGLLYKSYESMQKNRAAKDEHNPENP
jgi:hypothetical protein